MTDDALDMTTLLTTHAASRRDLEHGEHIDAPNEGWRIFEHMLRMHDTIEDDLLWPVARAATDRSDDLALLDEMEAEHKEIDTRARRTRSGTREWVVIRDCNARSRNARS